MESLPVDRINAVCEQLAGFIVKEILEASSTMTDISTEGPLET